MSEGPADRTEALFYEAADLPPESQRALLDAACRGDPGLRAAVERLLADDARLRTGADAPIFLNSPLVRPVTVPTLVAAPAAGGGRWPRVERYRVGRVLGEGGMGTVYEAEQDNPRRSVALKVIRPGLVSAALLRRFAQEAQILGRLHHPWHRPDPRGRRGGGRRAVLRHGTHPRAGAGRVRPPPRPRCGRPPGDAGAGVRRGAARPRAGGHSPRPQALQHPGGRERPAQGARLRRRPRHRRRPAGQHGPHPDRAADRHAGLHESRTGRGRPRRAGRALRRVHPGGDPLRAARGPAALPRGACCPCRRRPG